MNAKTNVFLILLAGALGAEAVRVQGILDVGGSGTIGDTTIPVSAGIASLPSDGSNWRAAGGEGIVYSSLTSPAFTVPASHVDGEMVTLKITHRYNFEDDWDGGVIFGDINGAGEAYVAETASSQNGYTANNLIGTVWTDGRWAFNSATAGWFGGALVETIATIGPVNQGDTIAVTFRGGWDDAYNQATDTTTPYGGPGPAWEIATFELSDSTSAVFADLDFAADGASDFTVASDPGLSGPWNYAPPVHRFEIDVDSLAADRYASDTPGSVIDLDGAVLSVAVLAGSLDVGDSFTLFDLSNGSTLQGSYARISLPPGTWDVSNLAIDGTIVFEEQPALTSFDVNNTASPAADEMQAEFEPLNLTGDGSRNRITLTTSAGMDEFRDRGTGAAALTGHSLAPLLRDFGFENDPAGAATVTFDLEGLEPNTDYAITVYSYDSAGNNGSTSDWYQDAVAGAPLLTHTVTSNNPDTSYFTLYLTSDPTGRITIAAASTSIVIFNGMTVTRLGDADVFSVNFYAYGAGPGWPTEAEKSTLKLNPAQTAGLDEWATNSWRNIVVPWAPPAPQAPVTLTSSHGSTATFTLNDCRNGGPYIWENPRATLLGDPNANLMDGHVNSTLDPGDESNIFDMVVTDIPFPV